MTLPPPPPFPDPTINEMIGDQADLRARIDALLNEFHRNHAGLRLEPALHNSWNELHLSLEAGLDRTASTFDPIDARVALNNLGMNICRLLRPFSKKYSQAALSMGIDYIQGEAQSTVSLHF